MDPTSAYNNNLDIYSIEERGEKSSDKQSPLQQYYAQGEESKKTVNFKKT